MPKQYQTELDGSAEAFNLFAEETNDGEKMQREREQRERDREEAAAITQRQQLEFVC